MPQVQGAEDRATQATHRYAEERGRKATPQMGYFRTGTSRTSPTDGLSRLQECLGRPLESRLERSGSPVRLFESLVRPFESFVLL
ncbi:MAG: hypothetical protein AUK47_15640 [Deltaproteobacteria bacterium CG2_30_63_29]|nr:MAG: hypothetical protein AUK47_15640 [Deltaproteobacteria bacterium CG2_30_63_29]